MTRITKQHRSRVPAARRGVAVSEFALVFSVFFVIVLGFLDLGVMLLKHRLLADAAQRVSREAIIRGGRSQPTAQQWGPAAWSTNGADSQINSLITPALATMAANEIQVDVQWTDGNNQPGSRVQVTMTHQHDAILPLIWSENQLSLQAGCVDRIAH